MITFKRKKSVDSKNKIKPHIQPVKLSVDKSNLISTVSSITGCTTEIIVTKFTKTNHQTLENKKENSNYMTVADLYFNFNLCLQLEKDKQML